MSVSANLSEYANLINLSTDVGFWYDANDVSGNNGDFVNTLSSRHVTNNAIASVTNAFTLQHDSEGYKCLSHSDNKFYISTTGVTINANECFLGIMNVSTTGGFAGTAVISNNNFQYAGNTIVYSSPFNKKLIFMGFLTPTRMELWVNNILIGFINNPSTTGSAPSNRVFSGGVNTGLNLREFYAAIYLKNVPTADKLKKLVRRLAFEHGIKI